MYEEEIYTNVYTSYIHAQVYCESYKIYQTSNICPERERVLVVEDNILFPLLILPSLFMLISSVRKKKRYLTIDDKVFSRNTFVPSPLTFPSFSLILPLISTIGFY